MAPGKFPRSALTPDLITAYTERNEEYLRSVIHETATQVAATDVTKGFVNEHFEILARLNIAIALLDSIYQGNITSLMADFINF